MALKLKIIISSTRPGRVGPKVADWIADLAKANGGFDVGVVDLAEMDLPLFDEPNHPAMQSYEHAHTKRLSAEMGEADAFVFVTPEYDGFPPAAVINAIQYLVAEWNQKPAGVVSYGFVSGGLKAAQVLRELIGNVGMMPLSGVVPIPFYPQVMDEAGIQANEPMIQGATGMLAELATWAETLKPMREKAA
ncbi:NADPH-dependent FMN reductase [Pseudoroseicyclus aestuarii]|uniref:NAD(P)H-dependent FMN reductase n=1 Tax=Pseudoroseicyclus aestuarii TaxID=1795041 RepID=A0A318SYJ5_9RHOB|nr:NAD(P)H-dependent oxidoreductase [Pseudoroseicyclus aestuarii]PYE85479.1 NAD(P)H-dependent FMN reductase [Pseudoroseicyclus aestuarii]